MKIVNETLKEHLPEIMDIYKAESRMDSRFDSSHELELRLREVFGKIARALEQKFSRFGLQGMVEKVSRITQASSLREWKRAVKNTLGLNIMEDYYNGEFYAEALRKWVEENVLAIKSIPNEALDSMQDIILKSYREGVSVNRVAQAIQKEYNLSKRKATLLARDQVSTLNSQVTKLQQQDAGCNHYRWSTSHDIRVRPCHNALNGKVISWDDPPEMWYETKKRGRVYTGRRCHPGEDYCCRCVAIPVFDYDTIDIPASEVNNRRNEL